MAAFKRTPLRRWAGALVFCCTLLSGCQSSPEPDATLSLRLTADDDANPDLTLRPSPTLVWVMQLSDDEDFKHAEFFSLVTRPFPAAVHGVLSRRSLMVRPGEEKQLTLTLRPGARHIALVAEFRDLAGSVWRRSWPLANSRLKELHVRIMRQSLSLMDEVMDQQKKTEAEHGR
uniref:type VI secretion system lipoprotein TssJ n=1 Tax=Serratia quinivorans TaxID=137545 RepID=UPI0035C67828